MNALISFINNEFGIEVNGKLYKFDSLSFPAKRMLTGYSFVATVYYSYKDHSELTDREYIEIFKKVNFSGTPIDEEHIKTLMSM